MKTKKGHLIGCVAEESGEVSQVIGKIIRFGLYDHHPKHELNNLELLRLEVHDLIGAYQALVEETGGLSAIDWNLVAAKKEKIKKYMEYSRKVGHLEPE